MSTHEAKPSSCACADTDALPAASTIRRLRELVVAELCRWLEQVAFTTLNEIRRVVLALLDRSSCVSIAVLARAMLTQSAVVCKLLHTHRAINCASRVLALSDLRLSLGPIHEVVDPSAPHVVPLVPGLFGPLAHVRAETHVYRSAEQIDECRIVSRSDANYQNAEVSGLRKMHAPSTEGQSYFCG